MASSSLANSFVKFNYLGLWLSIVGYLIPVWVLAVVYYKWLELLSLLSLGPNNEFSHISWILTQRYRNPLSTIRSLSGNSGYCTKYFNSSRIRSTRCTFRRWPNLQCYRNCPCFCYNFLHSNTNNNWRLWKLTCPTNNRSPRYSIPTNK